jgi:hypothetical protein
MEVSGGVEVGRITRAGSIGGLTGTTGVGLLLNVHFNL